MAGFGMDEKSVTACGTDLTLVSVGNKGGYILSRWGFRAFVPRAENQETDLEVQEEWQKKLGSEVKRIQQEYTIGGLYRRLIRCI